MTPTMFEARRPGMGNSMVGKAEWLSKRSAPGRRGALADQFWRQLAVRLTVESSRSVALELESEILKHLEKQYDNTS